MTKRILYIILGALLILALLLGLWFWFFNRDSGDAGNSNLFGSSGDNTSGSGTNTGGGNSQAPIGSTAGTGAGGTGGGTGGGSGVDNGGVNSQTPITQGDIDSGIYIDLGPTDLGVSGAIWNSSTNSWVVFNPTPINSLQGGNISGSPYITKVKGADGKEISLLSGLGVVIGGCIAQEGINWLAVKAGSVIGKLFGITDAARKVSVVDSTGNTTGEAETVGQCLTRTLGRLAVQQITDSTVNWINSGFEGKPAFVQDYNKFFTDVADQAAGSFIEGSNFAFLCSPFKLQVRIAIAQSYARRSNAPSCTLTNVVGNIDNFVNGSFSEGGWKGLITFTTEPSNNPFGAFMELQAGLYNEQGKAVQLAGQELEVNQGFLSVRKCTTAPGDPMDIRPGAAKTDCPIVTPGRAIVSSFDATTQATLDSLQLGESIDQILSALQNALINKIMSGLATKASAAGSSNVDTKAQTQAEALMSEMQTAVSNAQQYANIEQRIITDIQSAQNNLNTLLNCWVAATSSATLTAGQISQANAGATDAATTITQLETAVERHNNNIVAANASIAKLQELQTDLLIASVAADVTRVKKSLDTIKASGNPRMYVAADITTAQQDRDAVQNDVETINAQTATKLQQCYALGA